jgi:hypothetical protein
MSGQRTFQNTVERQRRLMLERGAGLPGDVPRWRRMQRAVLRAEEFARFLHWLPEDERAEVLEVISRDTVLTEDLIQTAEALMDLTVEWKKNQG